MSQKILVSPYVAVGVALLLGGGSARAADEETKMSGRIYADFTDITQKTGGVKSAASGFGIDVKRFYVSLDHKFDDMWSANITSDAQYFNAPGANQVNSVELFIKKAYLQAKISDAFILRAGAADTPWVPFVEGIYGYRFVENVIIDRLGFGTSSDWGLNVNGKTGSVFNYSASLVNGGGYRNPSRSKQMDVEGRATLTPLKGLTIAAGVYSGKLGQKKEGVATAETATRFDGLVGYSTGGLHVGAEYFTAKNYSSAIVLGTALPDKTDGFSFWASYDFSPMWSVIGRGDAAKLNKDTVSGKKETYFNAGVVSHPRKNVDIAFVYKNRKQDPGAAAPTKTSEVGVWAQVNL